MNPEKFNEPDLDQLTLCCEACRQTSVQNFESGQANSRLRGCSGIKSIDASILSTKSHFGSGDSVFLWPSHLPSKLLQAWYCFAGRCSTQRCPGCCIGQRQTFVRGPALVNCIQKSRTKRVPSTQRTHDCSGWQRNGSDAAFGPVSTNPKGILGCVQDHCLAHTALNKLTCSPLQCFLRGYVTLRR